MIAIDRNRVYHVANYAYKNFVDLDEAETKMVWEWRNDARIRQWMTNKNVIPFSGHLNFVNSLKTNDYRFYWLVYKGDSPIAVLDIIDVDYERGETEPGYYLNPDLLNSGEGLFFNYNFRTFLFNELGFESVKGNIKVGNDRAYTLSTFFGVKAVGIEKFADGDHLVVKGCKSDFNKIQEKGLLKNFVVYSKSLKTDWDELTKALR
jgi:UDP-4-amino-4,6-dideoxy-N-acetyl-beta-L-altrosamine N-acetyltransferase